MNIFELLILLFLFFIYTSPFKNSPWYEPDPLGFILIIPLSLLLLVIGVVAIFALSDFCKSHYILKINKLLPFISFVGLATPVYFTHETNAEKTYNMAIYGTIGSCILFSGVAITTIIISISDPVPDR
ncbi:hypothetical protein [Desulfosporosinus sp. SB140]|uniref:hypothetical protein n=1 Tax=Desulfosporosinus paludis TaxID=3115649 RepID=UPI0038908005